MGRLTFYKAEISLKLDTIGEFYGVGEYRVRYNYSNNYAYNYAYGYNNLYTDWISVDDSVVLDNLISLYVEIQLVDRVNGVIRFSKTKEFLLSNDYYSSYSYGSDEFVSFLSPPIGLGNLL